MAAVAHPLGLPALVGVSAPDDRTVVVSWQAAPDDVGALFRLAGAEVEEGEAPADAVRTAHADDPVLRAHLAATLRPLGACELRDAELGRSATAGVALTWRCAEDLSPEVRVVVDVLSDVDERYRSLVYGSGAPDDGRLATATAPVVEVAVEVGAADPTATVAVDVDASGADGAAGSGGVLSRLDARVLDALDEPTGAVGLALALVLAVAGGALHGLAPGHGKAIAGAYLLGQRGRPRHALGLGLIVALMHTGSTLVLGAAVLAAPRAPTTARLEGALGLAAGLIVAGIGVVMVVRRGRRVLGPHADDHVHDHDHAHDHQHAGEHRGHSHVVEGVDPFTTRGLVALGVAGGLLPSPTALLVVITAFATGRGALGLLLVGGFSVGLAATVTFAGLAVLWGRDRLVSLGRTGGVVAGAQRWLPFAAAVGVLCVGIFLAARAAASLA